MATVSNSIVSHSCNSFDNRSDWRFVKISLKILRLIFSSAMISDDLQILVGLAGKFPKRCIVTMPLGITSEYLTHGYLNCHHFA